MAEPYLERIFEAFVTLGPAFDRKVQGTGLGLSIVKGLVDAIGGTIDVASEPGVSSAFVVGLDLPAPGPRPASSCQSCWSRITKSTAWSPASSCNSTAAPSPRPATGWKGSLSPGTGALI